MRSVRVFLIGAVVAAAVAVPAIAAGGGSASSTPGTPRQPLCQTDAVAQLNLSAAQASAVRSACDTLKTVVAAADRAYAARVDKLAANDRAGLWQARQERRTAVWAGRDRFQATVHGTLGIARRSLGARRGLGRGRASADVRGARGLAGIGRRRQRPGSAPRHGWPGPVPVRPILIGSSPGGRPGSRAPARSGCEQDCSRPFAGSLVAGLRLKVNGRKRR